MESWAAPAAEGLAQGRAASPPDSQGEVGTSFCDGKELKSPDNLQEPGRGRFSRPPDGSQGKPREAP